MEQSNTPEINSIKDQILASIELKERLLSTEACNDIAQIAKIVLNAFKGGKKVFICGNGGSAADAQHIAAEFVVRFLPNSQRPPLPMIALTTDSSVLTACGNDFGYDKIFSQQLKALGNSGDVIILITTSGNSKNLMEAALYANENGITTIGLLGGDGGSIKDLCNYSIVVPSSTTARIQECHILIGHIICQLVDDEYNARLLNGDNLYTVSAGTNELSAESKNISHSRIPWPPALYTQYPPPPPLPPPPPPPPSTDGTILIKEGEKPKFLF
jgi:D-sedoheptulose 7-phosphate isomerase